jgi:hypothetical protein
MDINTLLRPSKSSMLNLSVNDLLGTFQKIRTLKFENPTPIPNLKHRVQVN